MYDLILKFGLKLQSVVMPCKIGWCFQHQCNNIMWEYRLLTRLQVFLYISAFHWGICSGIICFLRIRKMVLLSEHILIATWIWMHPFQHKLWCHQGHSNSTMSKFTEQNFKNHFPFDVADENLGVGICRECGWRMGLYLLSATLTALGAINLR